MLLNFGPTKDGVFTSDMYNRLDGIAKWMKLNGASIKDTKALESTESASVPATAGKGHRYLFLLAPTQGEQIVDEKVVFNTSGAVKNVKLLGSNEKLVYNIEKDKLTVHVPAASRTKLADVIDVELK
jgi:alpha-L-fucosidase